MLKTMLVELFSGIGLLLFMAAIPFTVSLLAAWAWGMRGVMAGVGAAPAVGLLVALTAALSHRPLDATSDHLLVIPLLRYAVLVACSWLLPSVPALIIGVAIRSIRKTSGAKLNSGTALSSVGQ